MLGRAERKASVLKGGEDASSCAGVGEAGAGAVDAESVFEDEV